MKTLGNILWHFPFFGFISAIINYLLGLLLVVTLIGAPIGLGLMEYGKFLFWPFRNEMVSKNEINANINKLWNAYGFIIRALYFPFGLIFCIIGVIQVVLLFCSILGIPAAIVVAKSLGTYFNPVNKVCVNSSMVQELNRRKAEKKIEKYNT